MTEPTAAPLPDDVLPNGVNLRVIRAAYDWTVTYEGEVHGLTAGDHGFEPTGIVLDDGSRKALRLSEREDLAQPATAAPLLSSDPNIMHGALCVAGTRIPVTAIQSFRDAGYSHAGIISEYPGLTRQQIDAAIAARRPLVERLLDRAQFLEDAGLFGPDVLFHREAAAALAQLPPRDADPSMIDAMRRQWTHLNAPRDSFIARLWQAGWDAAPTGIPRDDARLRNALECSVRLQTHYASLLNGYDGGQRLLFDSAQAWLDRLAALTSESGEQKSGEEKE